MTLPRSPVLLTPAAKRKALLDAEAYVRAHLWRLEDDAINFLYETYLGSYRDMLSALESIWRNEVQADVWKASDPRFQARLNTLMDGIEAEMGRLERETFEFTLQQALRAWQGGYYGRAWELSQGSGALRLPLLPVEAIRAQLLAPYVGNTFLARFQDARDEFVRRIRKSLIESQIQGEGIYKVQKRIADSLGIEIGRRTRAARAANQALFYRTEMIARTEILRASNLGAMALYESNKDILSSAQILVTNDERTCEICAPLDGQAVGFGRAENIPPFHPSCRCTIIPVLKDRELERGIVGEPVTYREWARANAINVNEDGGLYNAPGAPAP